MKDGDSTTQKLEAGEVEEGEIEEGEIEGCVIEQGESGPSESSRDSAQNDGRDSLPRHRERSRSREREQRYQLSPMHDRERERRYQLLLSHDHDAPMISAPRRRQTSVGNLRSKPAGLRKSSHLTVNLGKARALPELLALQQRHGGQFESIHIGAFWSRFKALARGELGELCSCLAPVCEQTVRMLPEVDARQVAGIAHALAKAGLIGTGPWQDVWVALPEAVLRSMGDFQPQGLSMTAWAFVKSRVAAPAIFDAIAAEAVSRRLDGFKEQELANTAWAFAAAAHASPELFDAISAEAMRRRLGSFKGRDLSITAWAFALSLIHI